MNRKVKIVIGMVILLIAIFSIFYFFNKRDLKSSLTISEKKWIEKNKNNIIDLSVVNGISVINEDGEGIVFDFLKSLEKDTGLEFNKLSYDKGSDYSSEYAVAVGEDGISLYEDNYVIVTKKRVFYNDPEELVNLKIGYLKDKTSNLSDYLEGSSNLEYFSYEDEVSLFDALKNEGVDGIVLPKLDYLDKIIENKFFIAYNIDEYKIKYVIKLGSNKTLNSILKEYFNGYKSNKYKKSLNSNIASCYFKLNKIDEKKQVNFRSKRYSYGFVLNAPFEININGDITGMNYSFIRDFSLAADIEIDFKRYSSFGNLLNDFNNGKVDLIYGNIDKSLISGDIYKTGALYNNKLSVITKGYTDLTVNNLSSLKGFNVMAVKDSYESSLLKKQGCTVEEFDNVFDLVKNLKGNSIGVIDSYSYDYYSRSILKDSLQLNRIDAYVDYGFIFRGISDNKLLNDFLDFYVSFGFGSKIYNDAYKKIVSSNNNTIILETVLSILITIFVLVTLIVLFIKFKKRKKYDVRLSKIDKLRYIDTLTSLKNRNYLNDKISAWDSSQVFPKCVIIVDLNNIAYINDNFGHKEGDKVISQGASVLVNNQLYGSEIIRTNGNEFLVFLVGHEEKSIITFIRKINKDFKELSHGFGAAIGYSMIYDEIKMVDDAINEATIDMKKNKGEAS